MVVGLTLAFTGSEFELVDAHFRLNVLGFLGLTIVGATYQFYPPTVGTFPGASDRTALAAAALIGLGLLGELSGAIAESGTAVTAGRASALAGAAVPDSAIAPLNSPSSPSPISAAAASAVRSDAPGNVPTVGG